MDFELSEQHLALRRMVRDFAEKEIAPLAQKLDESGDFPYEVVRQMGELGFMGLPFTEEYGGSGADTLSYVIAVEEIARVDCSVALTMEANVSLAGYPLYRFGTEEQKQRWLVPLAQGKILGAFGLTEPDAGSDIRAITTSAALAGGEWEINGSKCFITNAGTEMSGFVIVAAVTGRLPSGKKEISNIIVPNGTPGYTQAEPYHKLGHRASDTRPLFFTDCRVPEENLLGERGAGLRQFLETLDGGRIAVAAMGVGVIQACLDLSLAYAQERIQFGRPILDFQGVQFKLADMAVNLELARLLCYKAAVLKDTGRPCTAEAAMVKLFASEAAVRAAEDGVQIHGGYGYTQECPLSRYYRDAKLLTIGEGTSEVQRLVIARHLRR